MNNFALDPSMTAAIGGAFYPTGHAFVMFEDAADAKKVGRQLVENGMPGDSIYLIPPEVVLSQITPTANDADDPLPSAGTEGATVRAYTKLARDGHTALMIKTDDEDAAEAVMQVVRTVPYSIAQRYRMLVIEDL